MQLLTRLNVYKFSVVLIKDAQRLHNFYGCLLQHITYFPFVCVLWPNSFIFDDERRKPQGNKNYFLFFADRKMKRK